MSSILSRRSGVIAGVVGAAALAGGLAVGLLPAADAQTPPPTATFVLSNFLVLATNGNANLPEFSGSADGVVGAACTGATPLSGPNIPAQVATNLRADLTHMRILHNNGTPLTGNVRVNCVLEVEVTPEAQATVQRLRHLGAR
jgi:hypothetical protein